MRWRLQKLAFVLLACAGAAPARSAEEAVPRIPAVTSIFVGRELRVDARLVPRLPAEVERRLASGLPTSTSWEIRLYVQRDLWWDGLKHERRYRVTATYRPDSGDYLVERRLDEKLVDTRVVARRPEVLEALSRLPALPCFVMGRHLVEKPLYLRVRCVYSAELTLGVVPTEVDTEWARSRVFEWTEPSDR